MQRLVYPILPKKKIDRRKFNNMSDAIKKEQETCYLFLMKN